MISFKEFLVEASTGKDKWEKYFSTGQVDTIAKGEAPLYDVFEKPVKKKVSKGDKITVLASDEYSPKLKVRIGDGEYTMKISDIEKPFKVERTVGIDLKPDKLGIFGPTTVDAYSAKVKKLIDQHSEIPEALSEYLKALIDVAEKPGDQKAIEHAEDMYIIADVAEDTALKNTINNDFMEVLGPYFVVNEKPEYKAGGVKFPEAGNEPLYDFTMKQERGDNAKIDQFSSKRSGGNTNTLKVTEIVKAATDPAIKKKYKLELELLQIIQDTPVKAAPDKINAWLTTNFPKYTPAPATSDNTTIARLEAAVAKWINENSGLDFKPLVQNAVPDLWYVRAKIDSKGLPKAEPLKSGRELGTVKLRSKSSPGHLTDKLGFAI